MTQATRVLVWQWGRFGSGPKIAVALADGLRVLPDVSVFLSLSDRAEIVLGPAPPHCDLSVATYNNAAGVAGRFLLAPWTIPVLACRLRRLAPDLAICAMPGPIDLLMSAALRLTGIPSVVMVHDADAHPGDAGRLQMWLQRQLCRSATVLASLSTHVANRLREQGLIRGKGIALTLPPMDYKVAPLVPHDGPLRLLHFGRLLPYKGLDLLAASLAMLGARADLTVRIVGFGPESAELDVLRRLPNVTVENRWVPEDEIASLFGWSDALVLPYREASQSGVASLALAAGRAVVSTNVGGLKEQLANTERALLCDPSAEGLADAIGALLDGQLALSAAPADANTAWRDMAASLLRQAELSRT
jgi:glycosyltransferase involved in cell wall biosynthesis